MTISTIFLACVLFQPLDSVPSAYRSPQKTSTLSPGLELIIRPTKLVFKRDEPILIGIEVQNKGLQVAFLRDILMLSVNVFLEFKSSKGVRVSFAGENIARVAPPVRSRDDFIGIWKGSFFGQLEITSGTVSLHDPGDYYLVATYRGADSAHVPAGLPFAPWAGQLVSIPIRLRIK